MNRPSATPGAQRHDSIDLLRAAAILLMVQIHFAQYLAADLDAERALPYLSRALGMIPAPLFTFLAGMSLRLSLARPAAADAAALPARRHVKRGALLVLFGLIFAILVRGPSQMFAWDILPFIGSALLVLLALRRLPGAAIGLAAVLFVALAPPLRGVSGYAGHWPTGDVYHSSFTPADVVWGYLVNGYFPLFPWLSFPLAGFLVGRVFLPGEPQAARLRRVLPAAGLALVTLSVLLVSAGRQAPGLWLGHAAAVRFYPATTAFVLKVLGLILLAFWALHLLLDRRPGARLPLRGFFRRQSRFSLTTYVVHHLVLLWPLALAAALEGRPGPGDAPAALLPTAAALLLAALFVALFSAVLASWDRHGGRGSFEWLLARLAR